MFISRGTFIKINTVFRWICLQYIPVNKGFTFFDWFTLLNSEITEEF